MPESGFRAAQAYVEITAHLDEDKVLAAARRAAEGMETTLREGGERAGRGLTGALEQAGANAGEAMVRSTEGRLRDASGRFVGSGTRIGQDVGKGAEDESHRSGFRAFLGLIGAAPKAGLEAAGGLIGALKQGISGPAGPYLIAGMSAGAIIAGPFIGALLAGGIMAGIATAGIGGGIALAAQDPEIKHAFTQTGNEIGDILTGAAEPFHDELLDVAERGSAAFQRWEPMFRQIFGASATMLDPFVDALEFAGDRLLPTIMTTINSAGPAVDALADGIGGTVDAVADVIDMLGDNGPEAAAGLKVAFFLVESTIRNVGWVVNGLTEAFGALIELALDMGGLFINIGASAQTIPGPIGAMGDKLVGLGMLLEDGGDKWHAMRDKIQGATDAGSDGTAKLDERTKFLSLSMGAAVQAAGSLSAAFKILNGGALSAREAESNYQAAIDKVSASIKENGKTLDLHTEAGRNNDATLRGLISSTDAKAQATYDETEATKGSEAAQAAAAGVYAEGREQLIKSARQMGLSKSEAIAYADKIMKIPKNWTTTATANTAAATAAFTTFHKKVTAADGTVINYLVRITRTGDHYIPGQGTQLKGAATGGEIMGGSGYKDDVPLMAMGGEWVLQKPAVRALERQFGPDFMAQLNSWHLGGRSIGTQEPIHPGWRQAPGSGGPRRGLTRPTPTTGPDGLTRPAGSGAGRESHVVNIGTITLDASGMQSIQDVVELISGLETSARSYRARTATTAGR